MTALVPASLCFSALAVVIVVLAGRRHALGSDRLSSLSLLILLTLPLLLLLPGWNVLPSGSGPTSDRPLSLAVWLLPLGTGIGLARLCMASIRLRRWTRGSRLIGRCRGSNGRVIEVREFRELSGPCAAGVFRPMILVPAGWMRLPRSHREMVLAHETAHHDRRDPLWRLLGAIVCTLHWFNPAAWWLARRHAFQSEIACDAAVLSTGAAPGGYAHLLCDLAQVRQTPLVAAMAGSTLGKRVEHLQRPGRRLSPLSLCLLLASLLAGGVACGLSRTHDPLPFPEVQLRLSADPFPGNP